MHGRSERARTNALIDTGWGYPDIPTTSESARVIARYAPAHAYVAIGRVSIPARVDGFPRPSRGPLPTGSRP